MAYLNQAQEVQNHCCNEILTGCYKFCGYEGGDTLKVVEVMDRCGACESQSMCVLVTKYLEKD